MPPPRSKLFDTDGVDNTELLTLQAVPDAAPSFQSLDRKGVDASVTPQARLPFAGKAADDYGLGRLWFDYAVDGGEPVARLFAHSPEGGREMSIDEVLEVRDLASGPSSSPPAIGQSFTITAKAQDNRSLPEQPEGNIAAGDTFNFTVVSDADLLRLLEAREIMFREQFKALIEKVTRDRDSLVSVDASPAAPAAVPRPTRTMPGRSKPYRRRPSPQSHERKTKRKRSPWRPDLPPSSRRSSIIASSKETAYGSGSATILPRRSGVSARDRFPEYEQKLTALKLLVDRATKDPRRSKPRDVMPSARPTRF